jgi:hypothetical protein
MRQRAGHRHGLRCRRRLLPDKDLTLLFSPTRFQNPPRPFLPPPHR